MVQRPDNNLHSTPSSHAPEIQPGHEMLFGSKKTSETAPGLINKINLALKNFNALAADQPEDAIQSSQPLAKRVKLIDQHESKLLQKKNAPALNAIGTVGKQTEGTSKNESPSLHGKTHHTPQHSKKRKGK